MFTLESCTGYGYRHFPGGYRIRNPLGVWDKKFFVRVTECCLNACESYMLQRACSTWVQRHYPVVTRPQIGAPGTHTRDHRLECPALIHGPCRRFRGDQNDDDTRTFCGKFLYNAIASTDNAQHKNCPSSGIDDRPGQRFVWGVEEIAHFSKDEAIPVGRQQATRPDSDEDCIRTGEFPCYSHYAERLARLKQVPIFKVLARPGRDSNHMNNDLPDMKRAL